MTADGFAAFASVFAAATDDDQALFAGHVAFVVARGADLSALRPEFVAPLDRFAALVQLDDALSPTATAEAVDAFFVAHPINADLARAFEAFVQQHTLDGQAAHNEQGATAVQALLGIANSKVPVGATRVAGTVPGGTLGLLQSRVAQKKEVK